VRIEINLAREKPKKKKVGAKLRELKPGKFVKAAPLLPLVLAVGVFLLMVGMHFYQSHRVESLGKDIETALADSTSLSATIQMLKDIRVKKEEIESRLKVVKGIAEKRSVSPMLMDHVSTAIPELTWLTKWVPFRAETGEWVELEGVSFSNLRIADFMVRLETAPMIEEVTLINIHEKVEDGISTMVFTLKFRYERESSM
jgi:type IV pilus assembly protein PilN